MYLVVYSFMYLVVYLVVDSLVNLVVYYSVYLVVYLVYLVVHSSKQLSPLIKACNPISPVLLLSSRCFDFKALWIFPHHCPWSPYLFHNNCAGELYLWLRPTDPTVSQGGRGTHTSHISLIGMLGSQSRIANTVTNTKLQPWGKYCVCVCYICRDGERYCSTNRVSRFIVVTLVDFPSQSNIQTDIPTLDS